jgi:preprotein translocase subunit YajC
MIRKTLEIASLITLLLGQVIDQAMAQVGTGQGGTAPVSGAVSSDAVGSAASGADAPTIFGALIDMLPMLAVCYLIFYFMVIRPQERKTKEHKTLLDSMKRGDSVVTSSGILGKVAALESDHVLLEVAPNVKVKFLRQHIVRLENNPESSKAA